VEVLCFLPSTHYPLYNFDLRATHARTLLPATLASVSFGFVLVRVRVRWLRGRTIGALRAERHTLTSAEWTSCSACLELPCSRAFLFIVLRSAQHPQIPRFLQIFRGIWPMPLSLLNHSALALFAQRTRIPTSARSIGFCAIWVCISSSSSSYGLRVRYIPYVRYLPHVKFSNIRVRTSLLKKKSAKGFRLTSRNGVPKKRIGRTKSRLLQRRSRRRRDLRMAPHLFHGQFPL